MTIASFVSFFTTLISSSFPEQYSFISLCMLSRSLNTWMPLPLFKWVGFSSHRLNPSKWLSGNVYLTAVLLSKLNVLNLVILLLLYYCFIYTCVISSLFCGVSLSSSDLFFFSSIYCFITFILSLYSSKH
jgi:hypothetical protein